MKLTIIIILILGALTPTVALAQGPTLITGWGYHDAACTRGQYYVSQQSGYWDTSTGMYRTYSGYYVPGAQISYGVVTPTPQTTTSQYSIWDNLTTLWSGWWGGGW